MSDEQFARLLLPNLQGNFCCPSFTFHFRMPDQKGKDINFFPPQSTEFDGVPEIIDCKKKVGT